jgi:hypothetical protein
MKGLVERLGLPANVQSARRYTRCNGDRLEMNTLNKRVVPKGTMAHYVCGVEFHRHLITLYTVENGTHKVMCEMHMNDVTGAMVRGRVNCYSLGWMEADQEYFDHFIGELSEGERGWDEIELQ